MSSRPSSITGTHPVSVAGTALGLREVTKIYNGRRVVDQVSLEVAAGEFLAIIGPSGSGKTTVLRMIGGFESSEHGSVTIGGHDVTALPAERRDVSTVFQSYALFPHLTVRDNIAFGPRMRGVGRRERTKIADELLELVRLTDVGRRRPHELSGGMQQRVALARALANRPGLLLFDEPLGALDRKLRDVMQIELRRIQRETGTTFVYITHDQDEAFGMADRLAVMRDGRFVQVGDPAEIYDRPVDAWTAGFVGDVNQISGTLAGAELVTDLGRFAVGRIADATPGDRAVLVIRPERTRIQPAGHASAAPNPVEVTVTDIVVTGSRMQIRSETPGGIGFTSRLSREGDDVVTGLEPGRPAVISFEPEAAAAYAASSAAESPGRSG